MFVVARSTSSSLAVRGEAKAFARFVAGGASWPATASRLVRAVDLRGCVKNIILWYQVPHLRVALSDSGRRQHRLRAGREAHGRSRLSSRPCYGWLPTRASSEFVNEPPSRVRRVADALACYKGVLTAPRATRRCAICHCQGIL